MAKSADNPNLRQGRQSNFIYKMNSALDAARLADGYVAYAYNRVNNSGLWDTRPLFKSICKFISGRAQGGKLFLPRNAPPVIVLAVSGLVYALPYPFDSAFQLENLHFNPFVDQIYFQRVIVGRDAAGNFIKPYPALIMQDGQTRAGVFDGIVNYHSDPDPATAKGIPIGFAMAWAGHRLWVFRDRDYLASDILNPLSFTETTYLAGGGSFQPIDGLPIIGAARTADDDQLYVFTAENADRVNSANTDRSTWKTQPGFISQIFPGVGACSAKGIVSANGELQWMSHEGFRRYNQVGSDMRSSRVAIASHEMKRSFEQISWNVSNRICSGVFGPYTLVSQPAGSLGNRHTWVFDTSHNDLLLAQAPPGWDGVWTGIFPVEWITGKVRGKDRCFALSQDPDAVRLWECFVPEQESDERDAIISFVDTRLHDCTEVDAFKTMGWAELEVDQVRGSVNLACDYRTEGSCFMNIAHWAFCVKPCMEFPSSCGAQLMPIDSQERYVRTEEAKIEERLPGMPVPANVGRTMGLRIFGTGRWRLRAFEIFARQFQEYSRGDCSPGDTEACASRACCDQEPDYISIANDGNEYYYGSGQQIIFPDEGL